MELNAPRRSRSARQRPVPVPQDSGNAAAERAEARRQRIAEAAYYRAEKRGFSPGCEWEDWLAAEEQIDREEGAAEVPKVGSRDAPGG